MEKQMEMTYRLKKILFAITVAMLVGQTCLAQENYLFFDIPFGISNQEYCTYIKKLGFLVEDNDDYWVGCIGDISYCGVPIRNVDAFFDNKLFNIEVYLQLESDLEMQWHVFETISKHLSEEYGVFDNGEYTIEATQDFHNGKIDYASLRDATMREGHCYAALSWRNVVLSALMYGMDDDELKLSFSSSLPDRFTNSADMW